MSKSQHTIFNTLQVLDNVALKRTAASEKRGIEKSATRQFSVNKHKYELRYSKGSLLANAPHTIKESFEEPLKYELSYWKGSLLANAPYNAQESLTKIALYSFLLSLISQPVTTLSVSGYIALLHYTLQVEEVKACKVLLRWLTSPTVLAVEGYESLLHSISLSLFSTIVRMKNAYKKTEIFNYIVQNYTFNAGTEEIPKEVLLLYAVKFHDALLLRFLLTHKEWQALCHPSHFFWTHEKKEGMNLFHYACTFGTVEIVKLIADIGCFSLIKPAAFILRHNTIIPAPSESTPLHFMAASAIQPLEKLLWFMQHPTQQQPSFNEAEKKSFLSCVDKHFKNNPSKATALNSMTWWLQRPFIERLQRIGKIVILSALGIGVCLGIGCAALSMAVLFSPAVIAVSVAGVTALALGIVNHRDTKAAPMPFPLPEASKEFLTPAKDISLALKLAIIPPSISYRHVEKNPLLPVKEKGMQV